MAQNSNGIGVWAVVALGTVGLAAGAAVAQPEVQVDLGVMGPGSQSPQVGVGPNQVAWVRFEVPEISRCQMNWLDIKTAGFVPFDTEIGLYDSTGKRRTNNDDGGEGTFSLLSFGAISPVRDYGPTAVSGMGREGNLAAGVYYLAVGAFNTTFLDTEWMVFGDPEGNQGGCFVDFNMGAGDPVADAPEVMYESLCAGDAGTFPATAATGSGSGSLTTINGIGHDREDIDVYKICITDAANFSANTLQSVQMDTELYLFDSQGRGVTYNTDGVEIVQSEITAAVVSGLGNGEYYLAVAPQSSTPQDAAGNNLWNYENTGERLADGPGAANPVGLWLSNAFNDNTWYVVSLTGVSYCTAGPECGSSDFNGDGASGLDDDIEAFFLCLGGDCCSMCWRGGSDFNGDGAAGLDDDIESFFLVLGGGNCV